jgi:hypothetical protein
VSICTEHGDEVCYESRVCPACRIAEELGDAQDEIKTLERKIEELENRE